RWFLRDLGSLNGTFVNNERVRGEAPLKHGDEIALGATKGRFDDGGPLPASVAAPGAWGPGAVQPANQPSPLAQSQHQVPQPSQGFPKPPPIAPASPASVQPPPITPGQQYQAYQARPSGVGDPPRPAVPLGPLGPLGPPGPSGPAGPPRSPFGEGQ